MPTIPRPEHPEPRFVREHWHNLNGQWDFVFDPKLIGEQEYWYTGPKRHTGKPEKNLSITVPFPWESKLSGVERPDYKGAAWYEREFTVPAAWDGLVPYLNFEAVDWNARVWINGQFAAEHEGGYLPFSVDLSPYVQPGETATVTVRAFDIAEATTLVGKQVPRWYTHSSGIWQTVWLEGRAANHITNARIEPDVDQGQALVQLTCHIRDGGSHTARVISADGSFPTVEEGVELASGAGQVSLTVQIPQPHLWSPESPHLYDVKLELESAAGTDQIATYFGMRKIERGPWNGNEYEYILLNGEPVYLRGALDQAFHPDGLHSYPSDAVVRGDIELAKELGLNMLRCHIKINDPRYYYWCDKLGLLMMYDLPSPVLDTPSMRQNIKTALDGAVARDFNSPSIFSWIIFNETWGLTNHHTAEARAWLAELVEYARQLDPTRLIEDNSVCRYDHVETDINSWHFYINDYDRVRSHIQRIVDETYPGSTFNYVGDGYAQTTAPLMNSEYGGISAAMGDMDISWCFKYQTTDMRRHAKICGYVYTELDDIEWEHNGFVNYDRSRKEFGYDYFVKDMSVADLNGADIVGLDAPPCQTLATGADFSAPLFVSHWGSPMQNPRVRWQFDFVNQFGERETVDSGEVAVAPGRFDVFTAQELRMEMPNQPGLATIALWLEDDNEGIRCRNYVNVEVRGEAAASAEQNGSQWIMRFAPGDFSAISESWPMPYVGPGGCKFSAQGRGWIEYEVALPEGVEASKISQLNLLCEMSSRAGHAKLDWPGAWRSTDYPQTEVDKKFASDVTVSINGVEIEQLHLPDDPCDARGVLSHYHNINPGSFGYLQKLSLNAEQLTAILQGQNSLRIRFEIRADAANPGGISLFGDTLGCYPVGPTILLETT